MLTPAGDGAHHPLLDGDASAVFASGKGGGSSLSATALSAAPYPPFHYGKKVKGAV